MLDWYENQIERLTRRIHFWLISRLYPELNRIPDEKHRGWALWYSGRSDGQAGWKRYARLFAMGVGGPLAVILPAAMLISSMGRVSSWIWVMIVVVGWMTGFLASVTLLEMLRRRNAQKKNFKAMRIFGYDVCLGCGYDMRGHPVNAAEDRRCPECGQFVPPMQGAIANSASLTPADLKQDRPADLVHTDSSSASL